MTTDARRAELAEDERATAEEAQAAVEWYEKWFAEHHGDPAFALATYRRLGERAAESRGISKGRAEAAKLVDFAIERALRGKFTLNDWADVADDIRHLAQADAKKGDGR